MDSYCGGIEGGYCVPILVMDIEEERRLLTEGRERLSPLGSNAMEGYVDIQKDG